MHFVHNEIRNLEVSVNDPVHVKVVVILAERVDEGLSNFEPSHVEEELEEGEDGKHQVSLMTSVAFFRIQELPSHQRR